MKVNTDGVLLGAAMTICPDDRFLLDIGTGTGTIALMAAQRLSSESVSDYKIDAIDIDEPSATEAALNFKTSPWNGNLRAYNQPLHEFASSTYDMYDLIFSNPPYFEDSLTAPDERKSTARHTSDGLSYRDIFEFAEKRLTENGATYGLHMFRILRIRTVPRKTPSRMIAEFSRVRCSCPEEGLLTIQNEGKYTSEYLSLTRDFYLFA